MGNIGICSLKTPYWHRVCSFFLGATLSRTAIDWYYYTSFGTFLPLQHDGSQYGRNFLYQAGIGRNIPTSSKMIMAIMLEMNGAVNSHNIIRGTVEGNSGGNDIF